jgi:hypothetical protein
MSDNQTDTDKARKERSPSFPFISLVKAVERVREMADDHRRNQARLPVVGSSWGYGPKSSGLLQTVAALKSFGLIDDIGSGSDRKIQITDLGWRILHDAREGAKDAAIREAALKPRLIAEYVEKWVPDRPSDAHCMSELQLDRGFNEAAARSFLTVFDKTVAFAGLGISDNMSATSSETEVQMPLVESQAQVMPKVAAGSVSGRPPQLAAGEPYRMSFVGNCLDLVAHLETPDQIEELIHKLKFAKLMITPVNAALDTGDPLRSPAARAEMKSAIDKDN